MNRPGIITRLRVSWWLAIAQLCMWMDLPSAALAAVDYASRAMGIDPDDL